MADCSDDFFFAFTANHGTYCGTCGCGRTYFASQAGGWAEAGEIEALQAKAESEPDKYIDIGHDEVSMVNLGVEYVHGCKCGKEREIEDWLWRHRRAVATYLKATSAKRLNEIARDAAAISEMAAVLR